MGRITIPIDEADRLTEVVAGLMRNGLKFNVVSNVHEWVIDITGY